MDYILTVKDKGITRRERCAATAFNAWVRAQGEPIGTNFAARLAQLRRYTGHKVSDWLMTDDKAGTGENVTG